MMATSQGIFLSVVWLSPVAVYESCWKSAVDVQGDTALRRRKNWDLVSLDFRIKAVNDAVAFQTSKRYAGTMGVGALNLPSVFFPDKTHLISTAPPVIKLAGQRNPHFRQFTKLRKSSQKTGVYVAGALFEQIVGMNDKANQTILLED